MGDKVVLASLSQPATDEGGQIKMLVQGASLTKNEKTAIASAFEKILGLRFDLSPFYRMARQDQTLGPLVERFRGLKPPRFPTAFEGAVNGIACQQLSLNVGIALLNRLSEACAPSFSATAKEGMRHAFPAPEDILRLRIADIRKMGFSTRKAEFLLDLAEAVAGGRTDIESLAKMDRQEAIELLMKIRGVGRWTAEYVMLRGVGDVSAFPGDDVGGRNKLQRWLKMNERLSYETVQHVTSKWKPFPGLLYFHLLLDGLAKEGYVQPEKRIMPPTDVK